MVYFDMRDPNTTCPSAWWLTPYSVRTCGISELTCDSVFFPVTGGHYNRVCGTIRAYQVYWTDAFEAYDAGRVTTIDGAYMLLVSVSHMALHDNTSGHFQLVAMRSDQLGMMPALVMLVSI